MRTWLSSNREVAQVWAARSQPTGKGSNFYFEDDKLFSWGQHFCIARHITSKTVAMTTERRRQSTNRHIGLARNALAHKSKKIVYCSAPHRPLADNRKASMDKIIEALDDAVLPRIRQPRRDRSNGHAEYLAKQFNEYLAALPKDERKGVERLPETAQGLREMLLVQRTIERLER